MIATHILLGISSLYFWWLQLVVITIQTRLDIQIEMLKRVIKHTTHAMPEVLVQDIME